MSDAIARVSMMTVYPALSPLHHEDLVQTKHEAGINDKSASDERPIVEENALNEQEALRRENRKRDKYRNVFGSVSMVNVPSLPIVRAGNNHRAYDEYHAPYRLCIPKGDIARQMPVDHIRSPQNKNDTGHYFPINPFHIPIIPSRVGRRRDWAGRSGREVPVSFKAC